MSVIEMNIRRGKYTNTLPDRYDATMPDWTTRRQAYMQEEIRLNKLFRDDVEEEFQTKNHPKRDIIFARAWQYGQSQGHMSVYHYYVDLFPLIEG